MIKLYVILFLIFFSKLQADKLQNKKIFINNLNENYLFYDLNFKELSKYNHKFNSTEITQSIYKKKKCETISNDQVYKFSKTDNSYFNLLIHYLLRGNVYLDRNPLFKQDKDGKWIKGFVKLDHLEYDHFLSSIDEIKQVSLYKNNQKIIIDNSNLNFKNFKNFFGEGKNNYLLPFSDLLTKYIIINYKNNNSEEDFEIKSILREGNFFKYKKNQECFFFVQIENINYQSKDIYYYKKNKSFRDTIHIDNKIYYLDKEEDLKKILIILYSNKIISFTYEDLEDKYKINLKDIFNSLSEKNKFMSIYYDENYIKNIKIN